MSAIDDDGSAIPIGIDDVETQPIAIGRQILIVDDVPANLRELEAALAPLNRPLVKALSGREALDQLRDHDFSLVLMDVAMPEMDGYETARSIRAHERTQHLPIIFVAGHDHDDAEVRRAYQLGAVDFLFKPVEPEVLLAKVMMFVTLEERTEELATERLHREFDAARRDYETASLRREMEREHAAKEELARLNAALAENDRRKDGFLAILAHELRNPLAPIRTALDLIKLDPERRLTAKTTEILDRQTTLLTRLVEDLLDVSRIKANKIELRPEPLDLREVVDVAITTSRPEIETRRQELVVELPSSPVRVLADHVRMVQVFTNLLNNAARYTDVGGRIAIACTSERDQALVSVVDNGIGILPELLPSIFDMFVQERVRSDGSGGLGLGLALARQLVEMHRGSIRASSDGRGTGSRFEVTLPLALDTSVPARRPGSGHAAIPSDRLGTVLPTS